MRLLFLMPVWAAPSETWMQRMMEEIGDDLSSIAAWDTGGATMWRGRVRAVPLSPVSRSQRRISRVLGWLPTRRFASETRAQRVLLREIERGGITHVLCHYGEFAAQFADVWRRVDTPLFVHFHGYDATFDLRRADDPHERYFPPSYSSSVRELADRGTLIANSVFTRSLLVEAGIPADRIALKYLGVPVPSVRKKHAEAAEVRIVHLGRLVDFKSPDRTIRAFEKARAQGLRGQLVIAGDGPLRVTCELLRSRSPYRDSIEILGAVDTDTAQRLLSEADIYTQHNITGEISRQTECFGVSVVEAMAMGLPVVGTRSGGVQETVVDGVTGYLVAPGDVDAQAEALLRLGGAPDLRQRLGDAGQERVRERFSMDLERKTLLSILNAPNIRRADG
jgi:colanic acid/amylovoran biosynthesis glycosyltransferase